MIRPEFLSEHYRLGLSLIEALRVEPGFRGVSNGLGNQNLTEELHQQLRTTYGQKGRERRGIGDDYHP